MQARHQVDGNEKLFATPTAQRARDGIGQKSDVPIEIDQHACFTLCITQPRKRSKNNNNID
jgi:hypothetical protein